MYASDNSHKIEHRAVNVVAVSIAITVAGFVIAHVSDIANAVAAFNSLTKVLN